MPNDSRKFSGTHKTHFYNKEPIEIKIYIKAAIKWNSITVGGHQVYNKTILTNKPLMVVSYYSGTNRMMALMKEH